MTNPAEVAHLLRIPLPEIGESLAPLRIARPALEERMRQSLEAHGQLTPLTVWIQDKRYELVDGFKRLHAARRIAGLTELKAQVGARDGIAAKRALLTLNQMGVALLALEEAWVIHSLVREDHLTQQKVAEILGRDRSWVSRRLSLVERLVEPAQEEMRLGLLSPTVARTLASVPRGTQEKLLSVLHHETLTSRQVAGLVALVATANPAAVEEILTHPQEFLSNARERMEPHRDWRLGPVAIELERQTRLVLQSAARLETMLEQRSFLELKKTEQTLLKEALRILWKQLVQLQQKMRSKLCPTSPSPERQDDPSAPCSSPAAPILRTSSPTNTV